MKQRKQNRKKRPPLMAAIIVTLLSLMVLITTMAMFTSKDLITNTFLSGSINIELYEPNWKESNAKNIVPGTMLNKDPKIKNVDKLDAYVFIRVTIPCGLYQIENKENNKGAILSNGTTSVPLYKFVVEDSYKDDTSFDQTVRKNWILVEQGGDNYSHYYVYGYKGSDAGLTRLHQDAVTEPLFDKIILTNINEVNFDNNRDYSVRVEAFGIQADYLGAETNEPKTVWEKIKSN